MHCIKLNDKISTQHHTFLTQTLCVWNREPDVHVCIFNVWGCIEIFPIKFYEQIYSKTNSFSDKLYFLLHGINIICVINNGVL